MLRAPDGKRRALRPVRPNRGIEAAYAKRLRAEIDRMHRDVMAVIRRTYRANPPENMAADRSPAFELNRAMAALVTRWQKIFDDIAQAVAKRFAGSAMAAADAGMRSTLKTAGLTVKWKLTPAANDAYRAVIAENVALIKSIPAQYLTQVQGGVMRSVAAGRDLEILTKSLQKQYGVTRRRAELIARDQNNKATAVITKTRMTEAGITQAMWVHSGGGATPRPSHVKAGRDRLTYTVTEGALIDGERIWPGQLINCRCVARPIVEGFT